jgi:transcription initiation factor TFIID subunit 6
MAMCIAITKSLTEVLIRAFCDPHKALTQHYGAVQGISALGASAVGPVQSSVG